MKKIFALIIGLLTVTAAMAATGNTTGSSKQPLLVVGVCHVGDSIWYTSVDSESRVKGRDSSELYRVVLSYLVTTTARTDNDYTLKFEVKGVEPAKDAKSVIRAGGLKALRGLPIVVKTTVGFVEPKIENWKAVASRLQQGYERAIDEAYKKNSALSKVATADNLKQIYARSLSTQQGVADDLGLFDIMFGFHGSKYATDGVHKQSVPAKGEDPAYTTSLQAGYGKVDPSDNKTEFDNDYYVHRIVSTTYTGKQVTPLVHGLASSLGSGKDAATKAALEKEANSISSVVSTNDAKEYFYYNGWPKACIDNTVTTVGTYKHEKIKMLFSVGFHMAKY